MSVPCPSCAREYDVTLFQFGRTIDCTCGFRLGVEARVHRLATASEPRFMVDAMLGRLARWLRFLGLDAAYEADIADGDLVRRSLEERRTILTRDRALEEEWPIAEVLIVESPLIADQLRQVAMAFELHSRARPFSRCSRCNCELEESSREAASSSVPARVLLANRRFLRCSGCGRFYWNGSHAERIRRVLQEVLASG